MSAAFAKEYVNDTIAANKIVIFSKSYCPYCRTVKNLFASDDFAHLRGQIYVEELDKHPDGDKMQAYLREKTHQSTVPNIFINQKHVGGCDTVVSLNDEGKLAELVAA